MASRISSIRLDYQGHSKNLKRLPSHVLNVLCVSAKRIEPGAQQNHLLPRGPVCQAERPDQLKYLSARHSVFTNYPRAEPRKTRYGGLLRFGCRFCCRSKSSERIRTERMSSGKSAIATLLLATCAATMSAVSVTSVSGIFHSHFPRQQVKLFHLRL